VLLNVVRNLGGGIGVAIMATMLARRGQQHQSAMVSHVSVFDPETSERLRALTAHFASQGADAFTAQRRAVGVLYHEVTQQAQLLAVADVFWVLFLLFSAAVLLLPLLQRVHMGPSRPVAGRHGEDEPAPTLIE
jgi:MFS transporter, DHA2 family, multidrug resistance protein